MAVEGFEIIDQISITSTGGVDIFPTDLTIAGPAGVAIELQVQIYQETAGVTTVNRNGTLFSINSGATIEGVINFTMLVLAGDTINFQNTIASVITILVVGGGAG